MRSLRTTQKTHVTESACATWVDPHLRLLLAGEETEEVLNKVSVRVCRLWLGGRTICPCAQLSGLAPLRSPHQTLQTRATFLICRSCGIRDERNTRWGSVSLSMDKEGERMEGDGTNLGPKPSITSPNPFPLL